MDDLSDMLDQFVNDVETSAGKHKSKKVKKKVEKKRLRSPVNADVEIRDGRKRERGSPTSKRFSMREFEEALEKVEGKRQKSLYEHAAEQCFKDPKVLTQVLKKLLPDLKSIEMAGVVLQDVLTDDEAKQIQQRMKQRFARIGGVRRK